MPSCHLYNARFLSISHSHFLSYDSCGSIRGIPVSVSNPDVHLRLGIKEQPLGVTISSSAWLGIAKSILGSLDLQAQQAQTLIGHPCFDRSLCRLMCILVADVSASGKSALFVGPVLLLIEVPSLLVSVPVSLIIAIPVVVRYDRMHQVDSQGCLSQAISRLSCCCMTS
ncbi:hypothetical protein EV702DRAFT_1085153 [Suillus placidus]|uniref:Uncharacterized protein n=1 Tax=Suillus placidus TaxID=48579 RepID=A0A9P7A036_9AGAM|nr:hypothetical protein EV702DRAFT_1085153 [Suillus placidus]